MSDHEPGADPRLTPHLPLDAGEVPEGDEPAAALPREVAEGDEPAAVADRTSPLPLGEVDGVDEATAGAHRTSPLPGGAVDGGDEAAGEPLYEEGGVELEYGEGLGVSSELEELLEEGEERDAEEAVEGRFDAAPLPGVLVLAVVGVLAGFVMVGLVWASERGCDRVRDSPNCGAAGFPLLVLAVVVTVVLAALALSRLGMPNPKLVAFLGVGFMLLIVLAFLSNDLFSTWTLLVVPVLTAITFLLANLIAGRLERADA